MERIEEPYPGLRSLLETKGMSVQAQGKVPLRVAVDQRGGQTLNRDAKTTGGIKYFASGSSFISKWTLNRADQAKSIDALPKLADLNLTGNTYKALRPSQILKSEKLVSSVVHVLKEEYINPFDAHLDKDALLISALVHLFLTMPQMKSFVLERSVKKNMTILLNIASHVRTLVFMNRSQEIK